MRNAIFLSLLGLLLTSSAGSQEMSIRDPAEASAYQTAIFTDPPLARAAALEHFVDTYPASVAKLEALEAALTIYLRITGNRQDIYRVGDRILRIDPSHLRALAMFSVYKRLDGEKDVPGAAAEARQYALKGFEALNNWRPPVEMSGEQATRFRNEMTVTFGGACGYGAFVAAEYAAARDCYLKSVRIRAAVSNLKDIYQLGLVELELQEITAFWYLAKADGLVRRNLRLTKLSLGGYNLSDRDVWYFRQMLVTGRDRYRLYHGVEFGWDKLVATVERQRMPLKDFNVKSATVAARDAVLSVTSPGVDPADLSFCEWEEVLAFRDKSPANRQAAERVWEAMREHQEANLVEQRIPVKVLSVMRDTVVAAVCDENQDISHGDLTVNLTVQLIAPPQVGSTTDALGMFSDYTPDPFMLIMKGKPLPPDPGKPIGQIKAAK